VITSASGIGRHEQQPLKLLQTSATAEQDAIDQPARKAVRPRREDADAQEQNPG